MILLLLLQFGELLGHGRTVLDELLDRDVLQLVIGNPEILVRTHQTRDQFMEMPSMRLF